MALTTADLVEGAPHVEALAGLASPTIREKEVDVSFTIIGDEGEINIEVTNVVPQVEDKGLELSWSGDTVTIKGVYSAGWEDKIIYIEKGQVTNLDDDDNFDPIHPKHIPPETVSGFSNVPEGQDLLVVKNDTKDYLDVVFDVTVNWEDPLVPDVVETETISVTHRIGNDWDAAGAWITAYLERNP